MNFETSSHDELNEKISNLSIEVPPRGEGRTTEQCEQWQIHYYLKALLKSKNLKLPFKLFKRERPDFEILNGQLTIGVEATEIINPDYAKAVTLPEAKDELSVIDPAHFKWGNSGRDLIELRDIVSRNELTGTPWPGKAVEIEFAQSIIDTVNAKHLKFINGFKHYESNVLLTYHNNFAPAIDFDLAIELTKHALKDYWFTNGFDSVVVHKHMTLLFFSKTNCFSVQVES